MNIYIAGAYTKSNEAAIREYAATLKHNGHRVTSTWHTESRTECAKTVADSNSTPRATSSRSMPVMLLR